MKELFENHGEKIALLQADGIQITSEKLFRQSEYLYQKIHKRTLVFSFCTNTIGSILGYVTFMNHGIVPLLLPDHLDLALRNELIATYHPEYLWIPERVQGDFQVYEKVYQDSGYCLLVTGFCSPELNDDLALLLTTSGSTGSPKLVRQSYKNIESNTKAIVQYLKITEDERPITTLPMNYTYGLSIINTHLYVGASILLTDATLMQKEFWEFFKSQRATSFGGVPYTYEMLQKLRFFGMELPSLRYMTQAGGKLSPELHKQFAEYANESGKKFVVMYGQTEATARMAYLPADKSNEKYGSMGVAIPGGRFELIDVAGNRIEKPGMVGELVYFGDNVTLGYAQCAADLKLGDERNGCLITGDMAKFDEDDFFYIVGRKKRFLKIFGNRVNLDECEQLIKNSFINVACACTGKDDEMHIFITNNQKTDEIRKFIADKMRLNSSAFKVHYIPEIPKNDSGKILYSQLCF